MLLIIILLGVLSVVFPWLSPIFLLLVCYRFAQFMKRFDPPEGLGRPTARSQEMIRRGEVAKEVQRNERRINFLIRNRHINYDHDVYDEMMLRFDPDRKGRHRAQ